ncbi:MAG: DUF2752 domain-containing protein [Gemmataceae bacterium]
MGLVRGLLAGVVLALTAVFAVAAWLNPYEADGTARRIATHQQLGLPPCTFAVVTGVPCPACGMTTSFALLAHGDVANSLRANWVGTLLAAFCALVLPWAAGGVVRGRPLFIRSMEKAILAVIITLLTLIMLRWVVVVAGIWLT